MPNIGLLVGAAAGGGKFTPAAPTLSYAGSGTTNNGKFTITNYDATYIYTATGGTVASNVLTVTDTTGSGVLTAKSPKGLSQSASVTAYRQAPTQTFIATGPFACHGCSSPGPSAPCCAPGPCGCGTFHNASEGWAYTGYWACCTPGYYVYDSYVSQGYTWSGTDYTNGQGEWWKIQ